MTFKVALLICTCSAVPVSCPRLQMLLSRNEMKFLINSITPFLLSRLTLRPQHSGDHASKKLTMMCHHHKHQTHTSLSWTCTRGPSHLFVIVVRPSAAGSGRRRAGPSVCPPSTGCCMSTQRMRHRFCPLTKPDIFPVFMNTEEPLLNF